MISSRIGARFSFDQFHPETRPGDAVGNEVLTLRRMAAARGIPSRVFCDRVDPSLAAFVRPWREYSAISPSALVIHYSHASRLYDEVFAAPARRILLYHNITPGRYLMGLREPLAEGSEQSRRDLARYAGSVDLALADSEFNAQELAAVGFQNVEVFPYVLDESQYAVEPDPSALARYKDGWVNILTVGRIIPQKCVEDCILIFDYFKKHVEPKSRLIVVGNQEGMESYVARLRRLIARLDLPDVVFTGRVPQNALMGYYKTADALLSMSEHEGFCVPLVEAMRADVPVFAYDAGAVAETMGGAGIPLREKRWPEIAEAIGIVVSDSEWRERILAGQRERAKYFSADSAERRLDKLLEKIGAMF